MHYSLFVLDLIQCLICVDQKLAFEHYQMGALKGNSDAQMKSNDPVLSYKQVTHGLTSDMTYAQVKVVYRSKKTGSEHEGYQFMGTGTQQSDASGDLRAASNAQECNSVNSLP